MKRILFILNDMERGGIPRVTLNLLSALDTDRVRVDVFCANPRGIFLDELHQYGNVKSIPSSRMLHALTCNWRKEHGCFRLYSSLVKLFRHSLWRLTGMDLLDWESRHLAKHFSKAHYDWVIATSEGLPADIVRHIAASRAIWIHNDYAHDCTPSMPGLKEKLTDLDKIVCVAEHARRSLCEFFPTLSDHTCTMYNLVNVADILAKTTTLSKEQCYPGWTGFTIVSIGRFNDSPKKFSRIPGICAELKRRGLKFRWFLIGSGSSAETAILINAIAEAQPCDTFVMLGEKANPYPFLKHADLFVITSAYETYPTVVNEALALGVPVLATDFKGVDEILEAQNGVISPIEDFPDVIERIIRQWPGLVSQNQRHPMDFTAHNRKALEAFYHLVGC